MGRPDCRSRKVWFAVALSLPFLLTATDLPAQSYPPTGSRSASMGGVYAAGLDDVTAVTGNPAAIYLQPSYELKFLAEAGAGDTNRVVDTINDLLQAKDSLDDFLGDPERLDHYLALINRLQESGSGLQGQAQAGVFFAKTTFGISYRETLSSSIYPEIDLTSLPPMDGPEMTPADTTNGLEFRGLRQRELILTGAHTVFTEAFIMGLNTRYIRSETSYQHQPFEELSGQVDAETLLRDAFDANQVSDSNLGLDVGMIYLFGRGTRLGLVGRNINSPSLEGGPEGEKIRLEDHWRAGLCFPFSRSLIAADLDITAAGTGLPGYKRREAALGIEFLMAGGSFRPRIGVNHNLSSGPDVGTIFTAGFGFGGQKFQGNIGGQYASDEYYAFAFDLGARF